MLAGAEAARGACTAPEILPLVDAAFERPGSKAAHQLIEEVCPTCPVWRECLITALDTGEHGTWGGASERTRRKYVKRPSTFNLRGSEHKMVDGQASGSPHARATDHRETRLAALGATSADVRQWALSHGIPVAPKGIPNMAAIEAFAGAQR